MEDKYIDQRDRENGMIAAVANGLATSVCIAVMLSSVSRFAHFGS